MGEKVNTWKKCLKVFGLYFYVANIPLKRRSRRDFRCGGSAKDIIDKNKAKLYERQGGRCAMCGEDVPKEKIELHHVLPVCRFPELKLSIRNSVLLCHSCHKEVHLNPYRSIEWMEQKADELGVNVSERYKTRWEGVHYNY